MGEGLESKVMGGGGGMGVSALPLPQMSAKMSVLHVSLVGEVGKSHAPSPARVSRRPMGAEISEGLRA